MNIGELKEKIKILELRNNIKDAMIYMLLKMLLNKEKENE